MPLSILPPFGQPESLIAPIMRYAIELDGVEYTVELQWLDRIGRWYISLIDSNEDYIIRSRYLAIDTDLFARNRDTRLPPGILVLTDLAGTGAECGYADLGNRCVLGYIDQADAEAGIPTTVSLGPVAIQDPP